MKREALRTESDTSQIVISFGFSRCRRLRKISIGTPPYCRLLRVVRRESSRPRCSCRCRSASASLILRARAGHNVLHLADLVGRERKERLVREDLARELLALAV